VLNLHFLYLIFKKSPVLLVFLSVIGLWSCNRFNQSYNEIPKLPPANTDFNKKNLEILNKLIEDDDENDELYWQRSVLLQKIGKPKEALSDIRKAIALNDEKYFYYKTLAQAYLLNNKYDSAIIAANYSRNSGNNDYQLNLILAEALLNKGQVKESLAEINYALKIDSNNYYTYYLRGMANKASGDTLKYQEDFLKALSFKPDDKKVYKELMDYYLSKKQANSAKNILDKMFRKFTPDSSMLRQKGQFYESQNKIDSAYSIYGSALEKDSSLYFISLKMGNIKLRYKDYNTAAQLFNNVLKHQRNNFEAQYKLAICLESLRKYNEAIAGYERAYALDTTKSIIQKDIARVDGKIIRKQEYERQKIENERRVEPLPELPKIN
jgi:tetratricopeptide (TPR) repeat protein